MTTWNNGKITKHTVEHLRSSICNNYTIDGVAGDTGGTLTCNNLKSIDNYSVQVEVDTGPAGYNTNLTHYFSGKTVVVAYDNPIDGHTVRIKVWGVPG